MAVFLSQVYALLGFLEDFKISYQRMTIAGKMFRWKHSHHDISTDLLRSHASPRLAENVNIIHRLTKRLNDIRITE